MPFKQNNPGCPCCECGPVCITVCKGSVVTLTAPDESVQSQTADGPDDSQKLCFTVTGDGTYVISVTHDSGRILDFSTDVDVVCSDGEIDVPYSPTAADGYVFWPCGCCLPVSKTLYYSDGTNTFTLTYTTSSALFPGVPGWEGCGPLETNGCSVSQTCRNDDRQTGQALGYVILKAASCCPVEVYSPFCPGSCYDVSNGSMWAKYVGQECLPPPSPAPICTATWLQVGGAIFDPACVSYPDEPPTVTCPPAFLAYDPAGGLNFPSPTGESCFRTNPGVTVSETAP